MDLDAAFKIRDRVVSFLNADGLKRRSPRPRFAIGITPDFKLAIRSPSEKDLERALGAGVGDEVRGMATGGINIKVTGAISAAHPVDSGSAVGLEIGASVGHYRSTAGTLGFFAKRIADGTFGFVSNNHVLADCDQGVEGDDILHPAPADNGDRSRNVVANLVAGYPRVDTNGAVVDAAFARIRENVPHDPVHIGPGIELQLVIPPLFQQRDVVKRGRSTGMTSGRISAFALQNLFVDYPSLDKKLIFNRQIEIVSSPDQRFAVPGDSGSLVVNPEGQAVGLLFAANADGSYAYANPIGDVLSELGVCLCA